MPPLNWLLRKLRPNQGIRVLIPSSFLRDISSKLLVEINELPAVKEMFKKTLKFAFSGDRSEWDLALQMPHYNTASMPAISWHTGMHFGQVRSSFPCRNLSELLLPSSISAFHAFMTGLKATTSVQLLKIQSEIAHVDDISSGNFGLQLPLSIPRAISRS